MDKASLIERIHSWRKLLSRHIYMMSGETTRIDEISRAAQRSICGAIISQMLASRDMADIPGLLEASYEISRQIQKEMAEIDFHEIPFEVLSDIHESYLTRKLVLNRSTGDFEYLPEGQHRKGKGIYYTPLHIVRYIVDRALGKYLWRTESGRPERNMKARTPEEARDLRILDPACGSGSFLAYVFDVLAEFYALHNSHNEVDLLLTILENHLYGIDLDCDAVDITSAILILKASERMNGALTRMPKLNIRQGNFLISDPAAPQILKPFNWQVEMPEVPKSGGFTMVLGNPPYGAQLTKTERKFIKSSYRTHRSSDSSSLFVEKAVNMLSDNGFLGFIVPKSLSYVVSWSPIREFLLNECKIVEIADAREAFRGVLLEQMVIIAQKRGDSDAQTTISILRPEDFVVSHSIDSAALNVERFSIWFSNSRIRDIVNRIWERSAPLGDLAEIWNGLNIRVSDVPDSEYSFPCLRGRDVQRYHIRQDMWYAKITDTVKRHRHSSKAFCKPKIVAQDIIAHIQNPLPHIKLTTTIDKSANWFNVNTVTNIASSEYYLEYLCGILNSRLISWYAYDFIYNRAARTMHFRTGYADHIPIRRIDLDNPCDKLVYEQLVDYVIRIMNLHDEQTATANEIAELDINIDQLIYRLYGISDEDIRFLKEHAGLYSPGQ